MKTQKIYKAGDKITVSYDRSSKIDFIAFLSFRRKDLEKKWSEQDGLKHEVWEVLTQNNVRFLVERNLSNSSESEFTVEPDFDGDL